MIVFDTHLHNHRMEKNGMNKSRHADTQATQTDVLAEILLVTCATAHSLDKGRLNEKHDPTAISPTS